MHTVRSAAILLSWALLCACTRPAPTPLALRGEGNLRSGPVALQAGYYTISRTVDADRPCHLHAQLSESKGRYLLQFDGPPIPEPGSASWVTDWHYLQEGEYVLNVDSECGSWNVSISPQQYFDIESIMEIDGGRRVIPRLPGLADPEWLERQPPPLVRAAARAAAAPRPEVNPLAGLEMFVNAEAVRLRSGPGGAILAIIERGDPVILSGAAANVEGLQWVEVNAAGRMGWAAADLLSTTPPPPPPANPTPTLTPTPVLTPIVVPTLQPTGLPPTVSATQTLAAPTEVPPPAEPPTSTPEPTVEPSAEPEMTETPTPTAAPATAVPATAAPAPTSAPTAAPTETTAPPAESTQTAEPTSTAGTVQPTNTSGTAQPTSTSGEAQPTGTAGTAQPTGTTGTAQPTGTTGTAQPTSAATTAPTSGATTAPTSGATTAPTSGATAAPTSGATFVPTTAPTAAPTSAPTSVPPTSPPANTPVPLPILR